MNFSRRASTRGGLNLTYQKYNCIVFNNSQSCYTKPIATPAAQRPERMFCARNGKVFLAEAGCALSHYDWFRRERWIGLNGGSDAAITADEQFFRRAICGWYVPDENALYCFREMTFGPDPQLLAMLADHLLPLTKQLGISSATKVFIGPRDEESRGFVMGRPRQTQQPQRRYVGTIREIVRQVGD